MGELASWTSNLAIADPHGGNFSCLLFCCFLLKYQWQRHLILVSSAFEIRILVKALS